MKISSICKWMKCHFYVWVRIPRLALRKRLKVIQKWPYQLWTTVIVLWRADFLEFPTAFAVASLCRYWETPLHGVTQSREPITLTCRWEKTRGEGDRVGGRNPSDFGTNLFVLATKMILPLVLHLSSIHFPSDLLIQSFTIIYSISNVIFTFLFDLICHTKQNWSTYHD